MCLSETKISVTGIILVFWASFSHISTTRLVVQWVNNSEAQKNFTYFIKSHKEKKIYDCHRVPKWFSLYPLAWGNHMKLSKEKLAKVISFCVCKSFANLLLVHTLPFPCSAVYFWKLYFLVCSANWISVDLAKGRHWQNPGGVRVFFFLLLFPPLAMSYLLWDSTVLEQSLLPPGSQLQNESPHLGSSSPAMVLISELWKKCLILESFQSWGSSNFLLFLISRSPYQLLANTSIIYVTNSLY